ncbi:hypothetical protein Sya03_35990 [Spirilliplanes yamanashiensis]|uniref:Uncharacterized protein n=2 Tax=Spirilliplanes yamanashiensis TaxID=42233 RepID=A0A8J3YAG2_9ACTN|nr:hypothetical protein Sya03_35990 [Spirilliplanes yamanashiensis]
MAAPRPRGLSTAAACRRVAAAGGPFFDVLFDEGTARPEGEPLPREYLDRVHRVAPRFVRTLRATAADARDTRVRRALNAYAAKVQRHVVDSPDLAGLTPENSGWLLDLGELCGDSLD